MMGLRKRMEGRRLMDWRVIALRMMGLKMVDLTKIGRRSRAWEKKGSERISLRMLLTTGLVAVNSRGNARGRSTLGGGVAVRGALEALCLRLRAV